MNKYLLKIAEAKPSDKDSTLKPHTIRALDKLERTGGLVAYHGTGTGKTLLYLKAIERMQNKDPEARALYISPASLTSNFDQEVKKHHIKIDTSKVDVRSYEKAVIDADSLRKNKYGIAIMDEVHKMKNSDSRRSKELRGIVEGAKQRLMGSATVSYNGPQDIAPLVNLAAGHIVLPEGKAPFEEKFVEKKIEQPPLLKRILGAAPHEKHVLKNKKELSKILRQYVDHYDLADDASAKDKFPTKTEKTIETEMSGPQMSLYKYMEGKLPFCIRMKVRLNMPLDKRDSATLQSFSTNIRQASNSIRPWMPNYETTTPKIQAAVESLEKDHKEDKNFRGLVYSNFLEAGLKDYSNELTKRGIPHQMFTGSLSKSQKDKIVASYNSGENKVLLISPSGAEGLNLKGTKKIQILDPFFNDSRISQVIGRGVRYESHAHLPKEERNVQVEHYISTFPKKRFSFGPKQHSIDSYLRFNSKTKSEIGGEMTDLVREKPIKPLPSSNSQLTKKAFELAQHSFTRAKYREDTDWTKLSDPVASVKRDGAAFFLKVGPDGSHQFLSRRESVRGGYPDRTNQLGGLSSSKTPAFRGDVYHVELVHTGHVSNGDLPDSHAKVSGILNSKVERALATQRVIGPVRAILLDVIEPKLETYGDKLNRMHEFSMAFGRPELLQAPSIKIGKVEIEKLIQSTKAGGHEGVIVTSLTAPESENVRVKIKHVDTYNLEVVGVTQEVDILGVLKDSMGALIVKDGSGKIVANVGTGFSREDRIQIWKDKNSWVGKLIQVKAMPTTAHKLRAPVYNGFADGSLDTI